MSFQDSDLEDAFTEFNAPAKYALLVTSASTCVLSVANTPSQPAHDLPIFKLIWALRIIFILICYLTLVLEVVILALLHFGRIENRRAAVHRHQLRAFYLCGITVVNTNLSVDGWTCSSYVQGGSLRAVRPCFGVHTWLYAAAFLMTYSLNVKFSVNFLRVIAVIIAEFVFAWGSGADGQPTEQRFSKPLYVVATGTFFITYYAMTEREERTRFLTGQSLTEIELQAAAIRKDIDSTLATICESEDLTELLEEGLSRRYSSDRCAVLVTRMDDFIKWRHQCTPIIAFTVIQALYKGFDANRIKFSLIEEVSIRGDLYIAAEGLRRNGGALGNSGKEDYSSLVLFGQSQLLTCRKLWFRFKTKLPLKLGFGFGCATGMFLPLSRLFYLIHGPAYQDAIQRTSQTLRNTLSVPVSLLQRCAQIDWEKYQEMEGDMSETDSAAHTNHRRFVTLPVGKSIVATGRSTSDATGDGMSPRQPLSPKSEGHASAAMPSFIAEDVEDSDSTIHKHSHGTEEEFPARFTGSTVVASEERTPTFGGSVRRSSNVSQDRSNSNDDLTVVTASLPVSKTALRVEVEVPLVELLRVGMPAEYWAYIEGLTIRTEPFQVGAHFVTLATEVTVAALEGALTPASIGLYSLTAAVQLLTIAFRWKGYQAIKMAVSWFLQICLLIAACELDGPTLLNRNSDRLHVLLVIYVMLACDVQHVLQSITCTLLLWITITALMLSKMATPNFRILSWVILSLPLYTAVILSKGTVRYRAFSDLQTRTLLQREATAAKDRREQILQVLLPSYIVPLFTKMREENSPAVISDVIPDCSMIWLKFPNHLPFEQVTDLCVWLDAWAKRHSDFVRLINLDGDKVTLAGPLQRVHKMLSATAASKFSTRLAMDEYAAGEVGLKLIPLLGQLRRKCPVTAVLHRSDGLAVVFAASRPTFSVEGMVSEVGTAILDTLSESQMCCSVAFYSQLPIPTRNGTSAAIWKENGLRITAPETWRIRAVGYIPMIRIDSATSSTITAETLLRAPDPSSPNSPMRYPM